MEEEKIVKQSLRDKITDLEEKNKRLEEEISFKDKRILTLENKINNMLLLDDDDEDDDEIEAEEMNLPLDRHHLNIAIETTDC